MKVTGARPWACAAGRLSGEELIVARNILLAGIDRGAGALPAFELGGQRAIAARGQRTRHARFRRSLPASFHADRHGAGGQRAVLERRRPGHHGRAASGAAALAILRYQFQNESRRCVPRRIAPRSSKGLADGTLEIISSDHAPHCDYEKEVEFDYAPFGIVGFETELALSLMQLYHANRLSLSDLIAKFTVAPARLLRLPQQRHI